MTGVSEFEFRGKFCKNKNVHFPYARKDRGRL